MITVLFSCSKCGLKDVPVQVPARESAQSDVVHWVKIVVGTAIGEAHEKMSPHCHPEVLDNIKIPAQPEAEFLGQQIE